MITLTPPFRTYASFDIPLSVFGVIELTREGPYENSRLIEQMSEVIESYTDTIHRVYEIIARIKTPYSNSLSCELTPLDLTYSDFPVDFDARKIKFIQKSLKSLLLNNKECGVWPRGTSESVEVYVAQILREQFDPITTGLLLEAMQRAILTFSKKIHNIDYQIQENVLEIQTKIIPDTLYI